MKWCVFVFLACATAFSQTNGIAKQYSRDQGIEKHPSVIFADNFEDSKVATATKHLWVGALGAEKIHFSSDVPSASGGTQSIWSKDGDNTDLYTILPAGHLEVYARWYVKYEANEKCHHCGAGLRGGGGGGGAGIRPDGSYYGISFEKCNSQNRFDTYAYWIEMSCSGGCWGNYLVNDDALTIWPSRWICVEVKLTLNQPEVQRNGELTMWWDGVKVFDKGGYQWRTRSNVEISKFDLEHYNDDPNHEPYQADMWYDDVVVASEYIGPINTGPVSITTPVFHTSKQFGLQALPTNKGLMSFLATGMESGPVQMRVLDLAGRRVWEEGHHAANGSSVPFTWNSHSTPVGVYLGQVEQGDRKATTVFVKK